MSALSRSLYQVIRPGRAALDIAISTAPILRRELIGLLRTRKVFWLTALVVAATGMVPLFFWPQGGSPNPFTSAQAAYITYIVVTFVALFFLVPVISAGAITIEREQETYEALYNTLIRPSGIVLGKLIASIALALLLIALTFPMICILYLLGGFEVWDFLWVLVAMALFTIYLGVVGLWCSMRSRRTVIAVIAAFAVFIALYFGASMISGFAALFLMLLMRGPGGPNLIFMVGAAVLSYGTYLAAFVYFLFSIFRRARLPDLGVSRRRERRALAAARAGRKPRPPAMTWLTRRILRRAREGIPDGWNPVWISSIRSQVFGAAWARRLLFWGMGTMLALVSLLLLLQGLVLDWGESPLACIQTITHILLYAIAFLLPGAAAAILTGEREQGKLDLLRGSLLESPAILRGKFLGALFGVSGLPVLALIAFIVFMPLLFGIGKEVEHFAIFGGFFASAAGVASVAASAGLLAAALVQRTLPALVLSYVFTAGYFFLVPLFGLLILYFDPGLEEAARSLASLSPLIEFSFAASFDSDSSFLFFVVSLLSAGGVTFLQYWAAAALLRSRWMRDP